MPHGETCDSIGIFLIVYPQATAPFQILFAPSLKIPGMFILGIMHLSHSSFELALHPVLPALRIVPCSSPPRTPRPAVCLPASPPSPATQRPPPVAACVFSLVHSFRFRPPPFNFPLPACQVFTHQHLVRLSQAAQLWVLIPSFDHTAQLPEQRLVTGPMLLGGWSLGG